MYVREENIEATANTSVVGDYDVLVRGGGTSGVPGAVSPVRSGAETAFIERYGFLGGVPAYCMMPDWRRLADSCSALLAEFARRVATIGPGPDPLATQHMEPGYVKMACIEGALEAGVEIYLHSLVVGAIKQACGVRIMTKRRSSHRMCLRPNCY